jgi:hypothetical protein
MSSYTRFYLKEANLADFEPLERAIADLVKNNSRLEEKEQAAKKEIISKWFNSQFIKWFKSNVDDDKKPVKPHTYSDGEPEFMSGKDIVDFTGFSTDYKGYLNHMIDYFLALGDRELGSILKEPYSTIVSKMSSWDQEMLRRAEEKVDEPTHDLKEGTDYEVISKTKDISGRPMTWVRLLTKKSYKCEGDTMGHCVGTYDPSDRDKVIVSLWNAQLSPKVTLELIKNKNIHQIKGLGNQAPANRYQETTILYVKNLLKKGYKVTGDGENIGMYNYESNYYFSDDPKWQKIYKDIIVPMQQSAFEELKKRIVTVAGEGYNLISSYITGLQKGFRYV